MWCTCVLASCVLSPVQLGANLSLKDRDGWTALDLVNSDLTYKCVGFRKKGMNSLYVDCMYVHKYVFDGSF